MIPHRSPGQPGNLHGELVSGGEERVLKDSTRGQLETGQGARASLVPSLDRGAAVTATRLDERFELEERGLVELKGKGPMRTFWLRGCSV